MCVTWLQHTPLPLLPFKRSRTWNVRSLVESEPRVKKLDKRIFPSLPFFSSFKLRIRDKPGRFEKPWIGLIFSKSREMNDRQSLVCVSRSFISLFSPEYSQGWYFFNWLSGGGRVGRGGSVTIFPSTGRQRKINASKGKENIFRELYLSFLRFEVLHLFIKVTGYRNDIHDELKNFPRQVEKLPLWYDYYEMR